MTPYLCHFCHFCAIIMLDIKNVPVHITLELVTMTTITIAVFLVFILLQKPYLFDLLLYNEIDKVLSFSKTCKKLPIAIF